MSSLALTERVYRSPRSYRLGGYALSFEAATPWAERSRGKELDAHRNTPTVMLIIASEVKNKHRMLFRMVGENENLRFMFVTQVERFNGYRGMPSSEIPQFQPCKKDETVLEILAEEGITQYLRIPDGS